MQNISHTTSDKTSTNGGPDKQSSVSSSSADKQTPPRASEGAAKMVDGAQEIASAASSVATDKARQVRGHVDATVSTTQAKASSLTHEASTAVKHVTDRVGSTARSAVEGAKDALGEVTEEASELLHEAGDVAAETYDSARDYAHEVADDVTELAQHAGERTVIFLKRASRATGKFVSLHALPLAATGASLGWLLLSMRTSGTKTIKILPPRRTEVQARSPRRNELQHEIEVELLLDAPRDVRASREVPTSVGTTMGVRRDNR